TWDDLLVKAQAYIQYEEVQAADFARLSRPGSSHPARESTHRSDNRGGDRGSNRGGDRGDEIMINRGKVAEANPLEARPRQKQLKEFVKRNNDPRPEAAEARAVEEVLPQPSGKNSAKQIVMSVSRSEDFAIPSCFGDIYTGPTLST
ncbi:hypothetical protein L195_g057399, partial [Trifolium pratense]